MAEVLGAMWFSGALKGTIHRPNWTRAKPNCSCSFHPNICGVQRTSWKRPVCGGTNQSENSVPSSDPLLPSPSLQDTSLSFIFPQDSQFCLCNLYCVSVGALFKRNNYCCIPPSEQTLTRKLCEIKLCLYGLTLCCSELWYNGVCRSLTCPELLYH